jgi:hypothetical protein
MKTEHLVHALAEAGPGRSSWRPGAALVAVLPGMLISLLLLLATAGMRRDFPAAMGEPRVAFKFVFALMFAVAAAFWVAGLARPEGRRGSLLVLAPCLVVVAAALAIDLIATDRSRWLAALSGDGPGKCLVLIVALSVPPTVLLFAAMRRAAPGSPTMAGAAVGCLGGAAGIAVFALECLNDSAIFVCVWYLLALTLVTAASALVGRRLLAW